jgi:hypothetical protein
MSPIQLRQFERLQRGERHVPCTMNYVLILGQMNGVDFANMIARLARVPSVRSVDLLEFVRSIQQYSSFTRGFLAFVFDSRHNFRLSDWIGVLWIASHTRDPKLKRHLAGLIRRRALFEGDQLLLGSLIGIGGRLG